MKISKLVSLLITVIGYVLIAIGVHFMNYGGWDIKTIVATCILVTIVMRPTVIEIGNRAEMFLS